MEKNALQLEVQSSHCLRIGQYSSQKERGRERKRGRGECVLVCKRDKREEGRGRKYMCGYVTERERERER